MSSPAPDGPVAVHPLTAERLPDLERLFGPRGACAGCWCMWWRLSRKDFQEGRGEGNRRALRALVTGGRVPGLLAYHGDQAIGWIAVEPREAYPRLAGSRDLAPVDDARVWSVTCLYVARRWRGRGLTAQLLHAAAAHARASGARVLEGYPRETARGAVASTLYTGVASTFRALGFREVARRAPARPVVRLALGALKGRRGTPARGRAPGRSRPRSSLTRGSASRRGR